MESFKIICCLVINSKLTCFLEGINNGDFFFWKPEEEVIGTFLLFHVLESKTLLMALLDFFDGNKEFESLFLIFIGWDE